MPELPESLRARMEQLDARSPLETVRDFLQSHVTDADSFEEIRGDVRRVARVSTRGVRQELVAIEAVLSQPLVPDQLARLVGWEANWVLDDPSDAGAARFLGELAAMLREVLAEVG